MSSGDLVRGLDYSHLILWICVAVTLSGTCFAEDRLLPLDLSSVPSETRNQLPFPYGISVNYTYVREKLDIDHFNLSVNGQNVPSSLVNLSSLNHRTQAETIRADAWLLSFLDLYGIGGFVHGTADNMKIHINQALITENPALLPLLNEFPSSLISPGFSIDYHGTVYGFGAILGGGYGHFFYSYDVNYTWTNINRLQTSVDTLIQEIRIRYKTGAFGNKVSVYTGASNEDIKARQSGAYNLNGAHLEYSLEARPAHPWNALLGTEVEFTPHWNLTLEDGFSGRNQLTSSLGYRF
ncbi:MAG TPA: hypothetical protein VMU10_13070 [Desulfomonilia bacterium]|nr:hypothetical protein [Desulfomonilia bacterium]